MEYIGYSNYIGIAPTALLQRSLARFQGNNWKEKTNWF